MKKIASIFAIAFLAVAGNVTPANAAPAAVSYVNVYEDGSLATGSSYENAALAVPANARGLGLSLFLRPNNASAWNRLQGGTRSLAVGGTMAIGGSSTLTFPVSPYGEVRTRAGNVSGSGVNLNLAVAADAYDATSSSQYFYFSLYWGETSPGAGMTAGNYQLTPTVTIDGTTALSSDFTIEYRYQIYYPGSATATQNGSFNKQAISCVDTSLLTNGEQITVTNSNNGVVGANGATVFDANLNGSTSSQQSGAHLATLAQGASSYTYNYNQSTDAARILVASLTSRQTVSSGSSQSLAISITDSSGDEISTPCIAVSAAAPTVDNTGANVVVTYPHIGVSGKQSLYETRCYAKPSSGTTINVLGASGSCTFTTLSASTTYSYYFRTTMYWLNASPYISRTSAMVSGLGPQSSAPSQVSVSTPVAPVVPVFKQPKFSMPAKIDIDTTGKVSLSGKDMGVSTVLIGGKEQKIDSNSDEKLVFDTTGLAKGVHDLVMKGAFGTYTIQKAIQVGEAVVTKVAAVSARQVGMAGGELSISGQGLEGTTQITMNGQVLEIVSKTDSKVTFKVPASTVASVNSIMIEGSFVPVIFKNAFSYTK